MTVKLGLLRMPWRRMQSNSDLGVCHYLSSTAVKLGVLSGACQTQHNSDLPMLSLF